MTLEQFRSQAMLTEELSTLLKNPTLAAALEICDSVSPSNGGVKEWSQPHMAHIQLGVDRGYNLYPQVLRSLATPLKKQEPEVEATYENPEEKE